MSWLNDHPSPKIIYLFVTHAFVLEEDIIWLE